MTLYEQSTANSRTSSVSLSGSDDDEGNDQVAIEEDWSHQRNRLYDREDQRQLLLDRYYRVRDCFRTDKGEPSQLVLINGKSGIGKSALAISIREDILSDGGFYISGKFVPESDNQQSHQRQPFAPYVSALNELALQISDRESLLQKIRERLAGDERDFRAEELHLLLRDLVPSMSSLLLPSDDADKAVITKSTRQKANAKTHAFTVFFRRFLNLFLSCADAPLVILLDDIQRADPDALLLLESLLLPTPPNSSETEDSNRNEYPGLVLMATCRSNEVAFRDPLSEMLRRVEDNGTQIVDIRPAKLGMDAISQMIADSTGLPSHDCHPMALLVMQETKGNALFAHQFIQSLNCRLETMEGDDLDDNLSSGGSESEEESKQSGLSNSTISDQRIARWIARQMKRLPEVAQYLLKVISCLGGQFDLLLLERTCSLSASEVQRALTICVAQTFIHYDSDQQRGEMTHDKFLEAAAALLSANTSERALFHLQLGRNLQESCASDNSIMQTYQIRIVDLMLVGKEELHNSRERENLALWCLQIGREVAMNSSFAASCAIDYFERGLELLSRRRWRDQYDLSLALTNATAELAYCQGNHSRVQTLVDEVQANAKSFMDQVQACMTSILSLGAQSEFDKAIALGQNVLEQLGHPLPRRIGLFGGIHRELSKTRKMLNGFEESDILNLKPIKNPKAKAAMTVIQILHPVFASSYPPYTVFTGSRLVRLTLQFGFSPTSAIGFALYSLTLTRLGNYGEGKIYGELAERQTEMHNCRDCEAKIFLTLGMGPTFANRPFPGVLSHLQRSHVKGLQTGDIETSMRAAACYVWIRFMSGAPLLDVKRALIESMSMCDDHGSSTSKGFVSPCDMICTALMGKTQESLSMDRVGSLCRMEPNGPKLFCTLCGFLVAGMYLNKRDFAHQVTIELYKRRKAFRDVGPFLRSHCTFWQAVVFASLGSSRKCTRRARRLLAKLLRWEACNPPIFTGKVCLVEALLDANAGRKDRALSLFEEAVRHSEKHGYIGEQALALEKAGMMLVDIASAADAITYLAKSREIYRIYGAAANVPRLDEAILLVERSIPQ
ncbi:expressed unknown protein [Seminavis robusta]|uniref:AAA+ ATPase domain-containing protein n=1 Tax=Seminavis robusta TaxID=568900 RepID=A0A9N8DJZ5_9STRA|nr:expressed unknown protein [Seminavis robusta]|eukprot:Sro100_g051290.1 n/a (1072) ;mRNA; r:67171-70541